MSISELIPPDVADLTDVITPLVQQAQSLGLQSLYSFHPMYNRDGKTTTGRGSDLVQRGNHIYRRDASSTDVQISDHIAEENESLEKDEQSFASAFNEIIHAGRDAWSLLMYVFKGIYDRGESFQDALDLLDKDIGLYSWISDDSQTFLQTIKVTLFEKRDTVTAKHLWDDFIAEKWKKWQSFPFQTKFYETMGGFLLIKLLEWNGKFTIISPLLTSITPIILCANLVALQLFFQVFMFKFFAGFNLILIGIEVFTIIEYVGMFFLLQELDFYLYDFRLIRYFFFGGAIAFLLMWVAMAAEELDLVIIKGRWNDDAQMLDLWTALIVGFFLALTVPTALVSYFIVARELTHNQLAWRKEDDFKDGYLFGLFDIDILSWIGMNEDPEWYEMKLKEVTRVYF